jgi:hypothetical protein
VASVLQQPVQLANVPSAKTIVVIHEDLDAIGDLREAEGGCERCCYCDLHGKKIAN